MAKPKRDHNAEIEALEQPYNDPITTLFQNPNVTNSSVETEHLKEVVKQAYSKKDIELKTDLTANHIQLLTRMTLYKEQFKSPVMGKAINIFMKLRVSHKRLGRKEFVQVAQSLSPQPMTNERPIARRFLGE